MFDGCAGTAIFQSFHFSALIIFFFLLVISIKVIYDFFIVLPGSHPSLEIKIQKILFNETLG